MARQTGASREKIRRPAPVPVGGGRLETRANYQEVDPSRHELVGQGAVRVRRSREKYGEGVPSILRRRYRCADNQAAVFASISRKNSKRWS
jgi:hypothetical protein